MGGGNFDPQNPTPLLLTNNSLTLSERELDSFSGTDTGLLTAAKRLVEVFYSHLAQNPSIEKLEKGLSDCFSLLEQGFTEQQINYAITWIVTHHPDTGSFSRVTHLIDQALKAREAEERSMQLERQRNAEEERKKSEEQKAAEEVRRIDEIKASLAREDLNSLLYEASHLVESEHGNVRFGRETLVQLKARELIRERFLLAKRPAHS